MKKAFHLFCSFFTNDLHATHNTSYKMYITRNLPNTRIDVADALRGIAVAGIILYHSVEHFDIFTKEPIVHTLPCDQLVGDVLAWLLSGKMYGVFAMLFGLSFFIMNDNQQQKHRNFSGRFAWRMCLLFLFGLVNVAFYDGDILMLYAVYGLLLIPISYLPSRAVWCIIALLAIQPVELFCLLSGTTIDHSTLFEIYNRTISLHENGTFMENAINNLRYGFELNLRFNVFSGRLTQLLCLFILGMQLGRHRFFYNEGGNLRIWHGILGVSLVLVAHSRLQLLHPHDDHIGGGFCMVHIRLRSRCSPPSLFLWPHESHQLPVAVHHRQFHLLWLWSGLLSTCGHHIRRAHRFGHGPCPICLWPLLVQESSSRSAGGPMAQTDVDQHREGGERMKGIAQGASCFRPADLIGS